MGTRKHKGRQQPVQAVSKQVAKEALNLPGAEIDRSIMVSSTQIAYAYSGPLPPPSFLKQYDDVVPGSAARVVGMAEMQTNHRIGMESKALNHNIWRSWGGLACAFTLGLVGITGGIFLCYHDKNVAGLSFLFTSIAAITGAFIYGKNSQSKERIEKSKSMKRGG